jgi:hypothetical protein
MTTDDGMAAADFLRSQLRRNPTMRNAPATGVAGAFLFGIARNNEKHFVRIKGSETQ